MAFRDEVNIKVKAGNGGHGVVRFDYMDRPNGGNGGKGGDIYLQGDRSLFSLGHLYEKAEFEAEHGEPGGNNNKTGGYGKDYTIKVPIKTRVFENGNEVAIIEEDGQKVLIAEGGEGGLGNHHFRKGGWQTLRKRTEGKVGDRKALLLHLELDSDVIFIGYPNAGKSSIINEITNADAKVAAYAFTTLLPQLGRVDDTILMDLPGLIEGTAAGKGVGTKFVKHTKTASHIAHCISSEYYLSGGIESLLEAYEAIWKELEDIDKNLFSKKEEFILVNKSDLIEPEERKEIKAKLEEKLEKQVFVVSLYDLDGMNQLQEFLRDLK